MRMLARREILFTNITALIAGFAMFGTFVLVPNFVEMPHGLSASVQHAVDYGFDASATKAGLYLLPSSFALLFAGPLTGLIGRRVGFKWPLAAGMLLVSISAGTLTEWHDKSWQILATMLVLGVGVGFAFAAMATLITEAVRPTETGVATGMNTVMRTVGGVVGGQVGAALLAAHTIPGTNAVPSVDGFKIAFGISAVVALIGSAVAVFITPPGLRRRERLVVATTEAAD
jgi:MFS family permease